MERRKKLIRLIHVARRDLAMDEDTYRAILRAKTGHASTADCTLLDMERVMDHLKKAGFRIRQPGKPGASRRPLATTEVDSKIRAVWLNLHEIGAVGNPQESALAAYVKRLAGVDDLRFLRGQAAVKVLESLKKWGARVAAEKLRALWAAHARGDAAELLAWVQRATGTRKTLDDLPYDRAMEALERLRRDLGLYLAHGA